MIIFSLFFLRLFLGFVVLDSIINPQVGKWGWESKNLGKEI